MVYLSPRTYSLVWHLSYFIEVNVQVFFVAASIIVDINIIHCTQPETRYLLDPAVHVQVNDPVRWGSGAHDPLSSPRRLCGAVRFLLRAPGRRRSGLPPPINKPQRWQSAVRQHPTCLSECQKAPTQTDCVFPISSSRPLSALTPRGLTTSHKAFPRASPPPWFTKPPDLLGPRAHLSARSPSRTSSRRQPPHPRTVRVGLWVEYQGRRVVTSQLPPTSGSFQWRHTAPTCWVACVDCINYTERYTWSLCGVFLTTSRGRLPAEGGVIL